MANPLIPSFRRPNSIPVGKADSSVISAIASHDRSITDLNQAFAALGKQTGSGTTTNTETVSETSAGVSSFNSQTGAVSYFPYLGTVNDQPGVTSYDTGPNDNGTLLVLNDASPIAISLTNTIQMPWFMTISNAGTGTATLTPAIGLINGAATFTIPGGTWVQIYWDNTDYWASSPGSTVGGVTQLVAGTNINLSPAGGTGVVTVNAADPDIEIAGHVIGTGATPTVTVGTAAGSGATITILGSDMRGLIIIIAGTGATAGVYATVTFDVAYEEAPLCVLISPATVPTAGFPTRGASLSASQFILDGSGSMSSGQEYAWYYFVVQ
jgi:hypothetical protein